MMHDQASTDNELRSRIDEVRERIYRAAIRSGRDPREIRLIAVTKSVDAQTINRAVAAGIETAGENRVQELLAKQPLVELPLKWHFIGALQRNKVRSLVGRVELIHSLDRTDLVKEIAVRSRERGLVTSALVQVNLSGEHTKQGLSKDQLLPFVKQWSEMEGVAIRGLMTIAPMGHPEEARRVFRELRELSEQVKREGIPGVEMFHLSMGMTGDFEIAVEEGATLVRVGTAIFGPRVKTAKE